MSRRDTIIIAVLVNAGLLAILFMMAINTNDDKVTEQADINKTLTQAQIPLVQEPIPVKAVALNQEAGADEVDNVLRDMSSGSNMQSDMVDDIIDPNSSFSQPQQTVQPIPGDEAKPVKDSSDKYVEITVKRGDALEKIARANGTTVDAIKKANNITSERLNIGQVLRIPVSSAAKKNNDTPKPAATTAAKAQDNKPVAQGDAPQYYTIKSGDNPWKIAKQFKVKYEDILKLNDLDEEKARNLKIGDKIRVK